jgi:predicted Zn-dependent peptidase
MTGPAVTETRVDGIRTVLAPSSGSTVAAGLFFRVGRADETLATSGITHLVEHLTLHQHGVSDLHFNGATADTYTLFHVEGTPDHVVEYLNGVCAALGDLPMHRLEVEKEILRTESSGRGSGPARRVALYRYGAQGYGLASYDELGLPRLDADAVADWARTHFTTENAVLWITSNTVPEGLDLRLPAGRRNPLPTVTSVLPRTPAWIPGGDDGVFLHAVVPRSTPASLYAAVLSKALFLDLRQQGGYSYTATADYQPRDRDTATIVAMADCLPEKREAVVGAFVDVLARLRVGAITEAELAAAQASARRGLEGPDLAARRLPGWAMNLLVGHHNLTVDELREEIDGTTVADLRAVAQQVHASALVQVPALGLEWAGLDRAPETSERGVHGREFPCLQNQGWPRLVVGRDGVSKVWTDGQVTVLFRDVAAMLSWPDGGRRLIAKDGLSVDLEPTMHEGLDEAALGLVDETVPRTAVVPLPTRAPDRIPVPAAAETPTGRRTRAARPGSRTREPRAAAPAHRLVRRFGFWACALFAGFMLLGATDTSVDLARNGPNEEEYITLDVVVVTWLLGLVPALGAFRLRRRR